MRIILLIAILLNVSVHADTIMLSFNQGEAVQDVSVLLVKEIYNRAGMTPKITPFPAARATRLILTNELDGESARIELYFKDKPYLLKVEPSFYYLKTTAFALKRRNIQINSSDDLKEYNVGILRGVVHSADATQLAKKLYLSNSVDQLFKMLELGRIDVVVDGELNGKLSLKKLNIDSISAVGLLAKRDFFHVLHPSQSDLVDKISKSIHELKETGKLKSLIAKFEKQVLTL